MTQRFFDESQPNAAGIDSSPDAYELDAPEILPGSRRSLGYGLYGWGLGGWGMAFKTGALTSNPTTRDFDERL